MFGEVFAHEKVVKGFQRRNAPGIAALGDLLQSLRFEKILDDRKIDSVQIIFFATGKKIEKKGNISGVRLNTVLGQAPFGDEIMEVQFVGGGELLWQERGFDGASVVNSWFLFGEDG